MLACLRRFPAPAGTTEGRYACHVTQNFRPSIRCAWLALLFACCTGFEFELDSELEQVSAGTPAGRYAWHVTQIFRLGIPGCSPGLQVPLTFQNYRDIVASFGKTFEFAVPHPMYW